MKPKLEYASHGPFVMELQTKLNLLLPGAQPALKVDGKYGERTVARVMQFQKSRGLAADGIVGAKTWAALDGTAPGSAEPPAPGPSTSSPHYKGIKAYSGMRIRCSCGSRASVLMLSPGQPAKASDCVPFINILPFGNCHSDTHPGYAPPTTYVDPLMPDVSFDYGSAKARPPCTPKNVGFWRGHGPAQKSLTAANASDEVIDKSATCNCIFGGIIHFG